MKQKPCPTGRATPAAAAPADSVPRLDVKLDLNGVLSAAELRKAVGGYRNGMGDGPLAKQLRLPAANLTEPHVSWHTHGDMFWWLSHGRGAMPGFASVTSVDERWHLINHLIALSLGHESRSISDKPAPFNPWLPSIDFRFQMDNNNFMSLSEWRGLHPVHLIIVNQENELQRVRDLLKDMNGFPAQLVVVSKPAWLKDLVKGPCEAVLVPDTDGVTLLKEWSTTGLLTMPVIMMSGHATIDTAVEATRIGAMNFLEKPISLQKLLKTVQQGLSRGPENARGAMLNGNGRINPMRENGSIMTPQLQHPNYESNGFSSELAQQVSYAPPENEFRVSFELPLREARDAFERAYFEHHLIKEGGSMTRVAERTGLERTHLYRKLKQLGVESSKGAKKTE